MKVVGLTGGVACGKSTVARHLAASGVPVIDADVVAREVVAPGTDGLAAIVARFGPSVIGPDGALDRRGLRGVIAADPDARRALEAITHPRIAARIAERLAVLAAPFAIVEAALMVETGSWRRYDAVIVVSSPPDVQLARLMSRDDVDEAAARALIATQLPLAEKERVATAVIVNDGDEDTLRARTDAAWRAVVASLST